jgi:hypothetical protein
MKTSGLTGAPFVNARSWRAFLRRLSKARSVIARPLAASPFSVSDQP